MPRYIDADALKDVLMEYQIIGIIPLLDFIDEQPTISPDDVRGVGKWIVLEPEIDLRICSVCEHMVIRADCNYCPNCGARLTGGEND